MLGYYLQNNPSELYRMHLEGDSIVTTISATLFNELTSFVNREEYKAVLNSLDKKEVDRLVCFYIHLPYITFPNYAHKKLDWGKLKNCSRQISILLQIINLYFSKHFEGSLKPDIAISGYPQLMVIESGCAKEPGYHAHPIEVGFSEHVALLLKEKFPKGAVVEQAIVAGSEAYLRLTEETKKKYEKEKEYLLRSTGGMSRVTALVRDCGVPSFSVPGNCACLGENPDTFRYDRDMHSHNLDTSLQQITMLVTLISFWNDFLKPLYETSSQ